jgi:hypothetical protein
LYVEIDSSIYFNFSKTSAVEDLRKKVIDSLTKYSMSPNLSTFGGRFKYSKLLQVIDNTDNAITSNITKVRIRRDLKVVLNYPSQYEICYGNRFHVNPSGKNIKSTGFKIPGYSDYVYFTDTPNSDLKTGIISIVKPVTSTFLTSPEVLVRSAGTVNYTTGEILIGNLIVTSTEIENNIIEIQSFPESNDIIALKDLYIVFDVSKSSINMIKDVIASGDDISGVVFSTDDYYRSSYSNGQLTRS